MFNKIRKIIKSGYNLFWQEKIISLINVATTIMVSFFIWFGFLSFYFFHQMIDYLQSKLDFSIYFKNNVTREEILKLQKILQEFPDVVEVSFIPQEMALKKFQEESKINPIITKALKELQANPLVDYLIVKAVNSEAYPKIAQYLEKSPYKNYIDYINYFENQKVIKKIINISNQSRLIIIALIIGIFIFSFLIIFNTMLISVYTQKDEIEVLRIIGAGNWFIRGPFLVYIFIFSFIGYVIALSMLILFLIKTEAFWPKLIFKFQPSIFIIQRFIMLNGIAFGIILLINYIAALMSIERYLKK